METLGKGTELDPGDLRAPDAGAGSPIVIVASLGEVPYGHRYRAKQDDVPVLVTVVDPIWAAEPGVYGRLQRDVASASKVSHRNLIPLYGSGRAGSHYVIMEGDPSGTTAREFARERAERGRSIDAETAYTLIAHLCNALTALHEVAVHGYITLDTVLVSGTGRVFLSGLGVGALLPASRGFTRYRQAGLLCNVAPEQRLSPPQLAPGTDVFGLATLFIELVTGRALIDAGQPLDELGVHGPADLVECLERATAPSLSARPPDAAAFKAELADAVKAGPVQREPTANAVPPGLDAGAPQYVPPGIEPTSGLMVGHPHPYAAPPPGWAPPGYPPTPSMHPSAAPGGYPPGAPAGYPPAYPPAGAGYPPVYPPGYPPYGYAHPQYPYPAYPYPYPAAPPGYPPNAGPMMGPPGAMPAAPMQPGAMQSGVMQPGAAMQSGVMQPGAAMQSGVMQPGAAMQSGPVMQAAPAMQSGPLAQAPAAPPPAPSGPPPPPAAKAGPPRPPPPPRPAAAPGDALEQLDAAIRKVTSAGSKEAAHEFTAFVDDAPSRNLGAVAAQAPDHPPESASIALGLGNLDASQARLTTIDGELDETPSPAEARAEANPKPKPKAPPGGRVFVLVGAAEDEGPYDIAMLVALVEEGILGAADLIRHEVTGKEQVARDVPELREALDRKQGRAAPKLSPFAPPPDDARPLLVERAKPVPAPAAMQRAPAPYVAQSQRARDPGSVGTMLWVALAVIAFGIAGWFLWHNTGA